MVNISQYKSEVTIKMIIDGKKSNYCFDPNGAHYQLNTWS